MTAAFPTLQPISDELTLDELIAVERLGLVLLSGGEDALARPVRGVHCIEIEGAAGWLEEGWVMLTTGVLLKGRPQLQRRLVRELHEEGVAALGFAREVIFRDVPEALLAEARSLGFPVFAIPLATPFREIVALASRSLVSADVRMFQRLSAIQRFLIDGIADREPEHAVALRLSRVLDATVALADPGGGIAIRTGRLPSGLDGLLRTARDDGGRLRVHALAGWDVLLAPVPVGEARPPRRLVVATRHRAGFDRLARPVIQAAVPLLGAAARVLEARSAQDHAMRRALLDEILDPEPVHDPHTLAVRAEGFGLDRSAPLRVVAVGGTAVSEQAVARLLDDAGLPVLCTPRGADVLALVQAEEARLETALGRLLERLPEARAGIGRPLRTLAGAADSARDGGIGRPLRTLAGAADSARDARLALDRLRRGGAGGAGAGGAAGGVRLLRSTDLDVPTLLVNGASLELARPQLEQIVGRLRAHPGLREALVAYFDHDLDVVAAAGALHLHPNSLRYRLGKLEEVIGHSLKAPATIAALHVALLAEPLLEQE